MKNIISFLYYLIQFTWGLPQNILGLLIYHKHRKNKKELFYNSLITYHSESWGGISLGIFIIINGQRSQEWIMQTKVHEFGHSIQSLLLGPLYLFVIGLPSMIWCNSKYWQNYRKEKNVSYFDFYPEKWANHLGSLVTKLPCPKE